MKEYKEIRLEHVQSAVDKLVNFIKPTYGPANNSIIISDEFRQVNLDDGVSIVEEFELEDKFENAIIKSVKEVARKTNDRVGDGTTGAMIILQALLNSDIPSINLKKAAAEAKEQLLASAEEIKTKEELKNVAMVSFNNEEMAKVISDIVHRVGQDGVISVEESNSLTSSNEIVDGLQFERGFISPYMISDPERMEAVLENPTILLTNKKISAVTDIMPALEKIIGTGKKDILIIAEDVDGEALALLVINKLKGIFNAVAVRIPGYGEERNSLLEDIAALTGSTTITEDAGLKLEDVDTKMFGSSRKVVITKDETTIISGDGNIEERIKQLKTQLETVTDEHEKTQLKDRIAKLTGGIALIKVGATTEAEMKKLKFKVEDAVNSTKLAFKSGVVPGGGRALAAIKTSDKNLNKALKAPAEILKENIGEFGVDEKIIDPVEVLIASIESAVSIVDMLTLTKGAIVTTTEENKK